MSFKTARIDLTHRPTGDTDTYPEIIRISRSVRTAATSRRVPLGVDDGHITNSEDRQRTPTRRVLAAKPRDVYMPLSIFRRRPLYARDEFWRDF